MKGTNVIPRTLRVLTGLALALAVLTLIEPAARAANGTWTNLTSGGLWSATANWSGATVANGSGSTAYFNALDLTADNTVHLDGSHTLTALVFGDLLTGTQGGWFLDDNASSGANILTLAGSTPTITVNTLGGSKTTTISAIMAGSAGLTKAGAGTLTLNQSAVNTFTGGLAINGGTVAEDFANLASTPDLINNANALTLAGGKLTVKGKGATYTCAQTLGNVTVNAGGGQIQGNNNGSTSTTITLGNITATTAGGSLLVGTAAGNTTGLTITTTAAQDATGIYGGRVVWFNGVNNTGYDWATTASGSAPYTLSAYSGYTALPASPATTSTVNYLATLTGTLTLSQSDPVNTLKIANSSGTPQTLDLGGYLMTLTSGGLLSVGANPSTISGTAGVTGLTSGNGSGAYDLVIHQGNSAGGLTITAGIGDNSGNSVTLTKTGPGTLALMGTNTYTGGTFVNAGTLYARNDISTRTLPSGGSVTIQSGATLEGERANFTGGTLTLNGGTWWDDNGFGGSWTGPVYLSADSFIGSAGYGMTIAGNVSGPGGFTHASSQTLTLNGTCTYTGPTIISGGTVIFPTPASLYNADTTKWTPAYITVASGAYLYLKVGGASDFTDTQLGTLLGSLTTVTNSGLRAGSAVTLDTGNANFTMATTITDSTGPGGGAVGLQKAGQRTLTITGANTYTGPTTLNGGNVTAVVVGVASVPGVSGALGVNSAVNFANDYNQLDLNGNDLYIGSLTGSGANSKLFLRGNTLTVGADNTSPGACSVIISGSPGNLTKIGSGTLTLTGANTYTGMFTLNGGIVNLGVVETPGTSGPLGNGGTIVLGGGTLQYSAANQYDYSIRFTTAASQAYKIDNNNQNVTWATALTSSGGTLTKTGTGILTLSGANAYTGATTVNGGILKAGVASVAGVSGALGLNSAVTLANTAGVAVDITGFDTQIGSLTGGGATGGNLTNTSAMLTVGSDNTSPAAFAGVITGTGGSLVKIGTGTLTLNNTEGYTGPTLINAGTLALGGSGSISGASPLIAIAAGATFDVSAKASPYVMGTASSLSASGTGLTTGAATLKGPATINLNARPLVLTFTPTGTFSDSTHPALVVAQGNVLDLTSVVVTLTNNGSALNAGTFTLVTNVSGTITGTPSLAGGTVRGNGIVAGRTASLGLSGDNKALNLTVSASAVPVTVTLARHAGTGTANTYGDTLQFDVTVTTATSGAVTLYDGGAGGTVIGSSALSGTTTCTVTAALNGLTAGVHTNIVAGYGGDAGHFPTNSAALTPAQSVAPAGLTVTGAVGNDKLLDGTAAATLTGTLNGLISGDTSLEVYLIGTGTFDNGGAVGTGLTITSASTLGGTKATSYTLTQPTGVTANIWGTAVWTNQVSGLNWSTAGNWTNGLVASGAGVTASFSQIDITHDMTVHLDEPITIGSLAFGDTATGTGGSWTLDNNGSALNVLTLASTNNLCTITVNALGANKSVVISHGLSLSTNVTVNAGASGLSLNGLISGTGALTNNGSGTVNIGGTANTYSGGTIVNSGTLSSSVGSSGSNGGFGTGPVILHAGTILFNGPNPIMTSDGTFNGGTLIANNGFGATWNGNITLNSNITVNAAYGMNFGGAISGAGGFTKTGPATMTLSGANSYTGTNFVTFGVLQCNNSAGLGTGGLSINNGATAYLNYSGTQYISSLTLGGALQSNGNYGSTASGATSPNDTYFTGNGTVTVGPPPVPPAPVLDPSTGFSVAGGNPTFTFSTVAGFKYRLISTDNVATPQAEWQGVVIYSPVVSDANGWVVATDISMTLVDQTYTTGSTPQRFYRVEASAP